MSEYSKILIVDDSLFSRTATKKLLEGWDFQILEAVNGKEALEIIFNEKPDLVFLDLLMPELDGFGVLKQLNKKGLKIPVIVVSADIQESTKRQCLNLGAIDYFNKPINVDQLEGLLGGNFTEG